MEIKIDDSLILPTDRAIAVLQDLRERYRGHDFGEYLGMLSEDLQSSGTVKPSGLYLSMILALSTFCGKTERLLVLLPEVLASLQSCSLPQSEAFVDEVRKFHFSFGRPTGILSKPH